MWTEWPNANKTVKDVKLHGTGMVKLRIMGVGITKGQSIKAIRVAPLSDPMEVTARNYQLSIRKADAEMIEVKLVEEAYETMAGNTVALAGNPIAARPRSSMPLPAPICTPSNPFLINY